MRKVLIVILAIMLMAGTAFATFSEKRLGQAQISNAANTTIYTVPTSTTGIVKTILICNTTALNATVEIWIVPNAGSASDSTKIVDDVTVPANDFTQIMTWMPCETGATVQAKASAATTITISVFGAEIT